MKTLLTALFFSTATVPAFAGTETIPPKGTPKIEFAYNKQAVADDTPLRIENGLVLVDVEVSAGSGDYYVIPKAAPDWLTFDRDRHQFWGEMVPGRDLGEIVVTVYDRQTQKLANGVLDFAREHHVKLHDAPEK